jgi:hypothetical protein
MSVAVIEIVIVSVIGSDRGGSVISEGRAGINSTDGSPIGGCTSTKAITVAIGVIGSGGFERGNRSQLVLVVDSCGSGKSGDRRFVFRSRRMWWGETESKADFRLGLSKSFTLNSRSETDRWHCFEQIGVGKGRAG